MTYWVGLVQLEDKFIDLAFSLGNMDGLDAADVKRYIRYITDRRLISLGLKGIMKVKKNPVLFGVPLPTMGDIAGRIGCWL